MMMLVYVEITLNSFCSHTTEKELKIRKKNSRSFFKGITINEIFRNLIGPCWTMSQFHKDDKDAYI